MKQYIPQKFLLTGVRLLMLVALVFSQFGQSATPAAARETTSADVSRSATLTGTITLWHVYDGANATALSQMITAAETANPGLTITASFHNFSTIYSDYETAVAAGTGPDLMLAPTDAMGNQARLGVILNLDSYLTGRMTNVLQSALDDSTVDGVTYAIPLAAKIVALYYNKASIATPPNTTVDLLTLLQSGKKLTGPGLYTGSYYYYGFWGAFGGTLMDNTGLCLADQSTAFPNAMQYLLDLQSAGAALTSEYFTAEAGFLNGEYDMIINGSWALDGYKASLGDNLGVVSLPAGPGIVNAGPLNGPDSFFVNPATSNPSNTVEVALYLSNQTSSQILTDVSGMIPVRSDVTSTDPLVLAFQQAVETGIARPQNRQMDFYWSNFQDMIDAVLAGTVSPTDGVQAACTKMNNAGVRFDAWFQEGHISAYDWPVSSTLTLNIDDPATADNPDYSTTSDVAVAPWDANSSVAEFYLNGAYTITPGMTVSVTGAGRTKDLLISNLAVTDVNFTQDTVSGTAENNQVLWMYMPSSCCRNFSADAGGVWSVDYKVVGSGGEPIADIKAGSNGTINATDTDGDNTSVNWFLKNPKISARMQDNLIESFSWSLDSTVSLSIFDPGTGLTHTDSQVAQVTSWDPNETFVRFAMPPGYTLTTGQQVTVSNGIEPDKTLTLGNIAFTAIDKVNDVVQGSATSGSAIYVGDVCENNTCAGRNVIADGSNQWSVDLQNPVPSASSPSETNTADLRWGVYVEARQFDDDFDETMISMSVNADPYFKVYTDNNRVQAEFYPEVGATLTLDVTRSGNSVFHEVKTTELAYWNNTTIAAFFNYDGAFTFQTGDVATLTGSGITKILQIKSLGISNVDLTTDQISGTAAQGELIDLVDWGYFPMLRRVTTGVDGTWTVDLSQVGPGTHEQFTSHLRDNNWGGEAWQQDADGDQVAFRWMGKNANIQARMADNYIDGAGWQVGTQVDLSIHDPSGTYADYSDSQTVGRASWNPNETIANFVPTGLSLIPGMVVTLSGSGNTRTHTIIDSPQHVIDTSTDTISGVTTANGYVSVNDWGASARRGTTATSGGDWVVDFASSTSDGEGFADIGPGSKGDTWLYDNDNNASIYNWKVPNTHVDVWFQDDNVSAYDFPMGATLTLTIQDSDPATNDYVEEKMVTDVAPWDASTTLVDFNLGGIFDIQPGMTASVSDGTTTRDLVISNMSISSINPATDVISGTTDPDQSMFIWLYFGNYRAFSADSAGNWTANYSELGPNGEAIVDILPDTAGDLNASDADGDHTAIRWSTPPIVLSVTSKDPNPSSLSSVRYTVTFSEPVTGVEDSSFNLLTTGLTGSPAVTNVSGADDVYTVTASTGSGNGTLKLRVIDNDTIVDSDGNPLGLPGLGNGNFTSGDTYLVRPPGAFAKSAPTNGNVSKATGITLTWAASANANSYEYCYDTSNDNNCSTWVANGSATSKALTGLSANATYYWQVRAKNNTGIITYANGSLGNFWSFKKDNTGPKVTSITRIDLNPTTAASVRFVVNFSESVSGVDLADFKLTTVGVLNAKLSAIAGTGSTRTLTVLTGTGTGTLRLDLIDNDTILDLVGFPLGGVGAGNGNFLTGEKYTLDRINQFASIGALDGWVMESSETSGVGGPFSSTAVRVGDDVLDKQIRSILAFDTLGLPDNAIIVAVTLKFKVSSTTGTSPFTSHGPLLADVQKGFFGSSTALQAPDFQSPVARLAGSFSPVTGAAGWYQLTLAPSNFSYINKVGPTQFRLRFTLDDNDNLLANYISIYGGESAASLQPILKVDYTLP